MEHNLIQFTKGLDCQAYQEIVDGIVICHRDLDGNILELPEVTESYFVSTATPDWAV